MINNILSDNLEKVIIDTIKKQCFLYKQVERQTRNLYYEPYSKRRKKYDLTAAILSGFAPDRFKVEGVCVEDLQYGLDYNPLVQPELTTDTVIVQLYSNGAKPLKSKTVLDRCKAYNDSSKKTKRFIIILFSVNKNGDLRKIEAVYPNKNGEIIERKTLHKEDVLSLAS